MSAQTATVEALTAEVRVLMVGNRQITLSVARQLDRVDYLPIDQVMGRVRINKDGTDDEYIGRDKNGNLVVLECGCPHIRDYWRPPLDTFLVCPHYFTRTRHSGVVNISGTPSTYEAMRLYGAEVPDENRVLECALIQGTSNRCAGEIRIYDGDKWVSVGAEAIRNHDRRMDHYFALKKLPLIVLAGLK